MEDFEEEQYDECRREYAKRLFACAKIVEEMGAFAPEDANPEWYRSRIAWFQREADEVWPDENSWPRSKENGKGEIFDLATKTKVN